MSTLDDLVDYFSPGSRERGTGLRSDFEPVVSDQGKRRHPVSQVDPRLVEAINVASQDFPYEVRLDSGYRPGDKRFHGKHKALDVELWKDGKKLSDYQDPTHFAAYEQFAQRVRGAQQQLYPELSQNLRWGGYFSGGKGKYGALDLMHFDLGGSSKLGMAGGSWEGGLTPQQARIWGISNSRGMGGQAQDSAPMGPRVTQLRRDIRQNFGSPSVDDLVAAFSPKGPPPSTAPAIPRGIRNNNPTNIDFRKNVNWEGQEGPEQLPDGGAGRFIKFATPEYGIRAATKNIMAKQRKGINTLEGLVKVWAPPNENDTEAYIRRMSEMTGYGRSDALDLGNRDVLRKLVPAFIQHENGQNPYTDDQITAGVGAAFGVNRLSRTSKPPASRPAAAPTQTVSLDELTSYFSR